MIILSSVIIAFSSLAPATAQDNAALENANQALAFGDYATALQLYTALLNDSASACSAMYQMGITYSRALQPNDADTMLTRYLNECQIDYRALVLRGRMRADQGNAAAALIDYQAAISIQPGALDSYLYEAMAALDPANSLHYLQLAANADRYPEGKIALRERVAETALIAGNSAIARDQYQLALAEIDAYLQQLTLIDGATYDVSGNVRARIEYTLSEIDRAAGQNDASWARLQRIVNDYGNSSSALKALVDLINASQPVDTLARVRINVANQNYAPVVALLAESLQDPAYANAELWVLLARAQSRSGDNAGALATYGQTAQQFPDDPFAAVALYEQGILQAETGQAASAITTFQILIQLYPNATQAPEALLRAANLAAESGDINGAQNLYNALVLDYPDAAASKTGILDAANAIRTSDPSRAATLYGYSRTSEGLLWQGVLLEEMGDLNGAQAAWRAATVDYGTLFSMRACERLHGIAPFIPSNTFHVDPITEADRQDAANWVMATFGLSDVSADIPQALMDDPILQRGLDLWAVGMWTPARLEFDALHKLRRSDPAALLQLAFYYQEQEIYRSSVFSATRLSYMADMPFTQVPRAVLQLAFPFYMPEQFATEAAKYNVDPLIIGALVRQETSYDPFATSVANAIGLMQLLPSTAADVAGRLRQPAPSVNDLYRPMVNIPLGVHYFAFMRDYQGGSIAGALISYNAGPGGAAQWLAISPDTPEYLYETITYNETRQYLDLIYQNYTLYRHLYGDGVPACMLEPA